MSEVAARVLLPGALAIGAITAACSSKNDAGDTAPECPQDLPVGCAMPPPSFAKDIEPIFERRCWACHTGEGIAAGSHDFSTYVSINADRSVILNRFYACAMPPPDAGQPTPEERTALLKWLVCKAPNN